MTNFAWILLINFAWPDGLYMKIYSRNFSHVGLHIRFFSIIRWSTKEVERKKSQKVRHKISPTNKPPKCI